MPVYKKRVSTHDPRFQGKQIIIATTNDQTVIPVPDSEVICNLCNANIKSERCKEKPNVGDRCLKGYRLPCDINSKEVCTFYEPEETFGWLIYFDKRDIKADRPYDFYCDDCTKRSFPKAIEV